MASTKQLVQPERIHSTKFSAGWIRDDNTRAVRLTLGGVRDLLNALLADSPDLAQAPFVSAEGEGELVIEVVGQVTGGDAR